MTETPHLRLSVDQSKVVNHVDGPILVVAGPGSGKTRVLTERVRCLLTGVSGHFRVLALTFTNKAADEMRERLSDLGAERKRAFIGTIHSFCLEMLTERGRLVGIEGMPHIFEQYRDRRDVLLKAIREDPYLQDEIGTVVDERARNRRVDEWLQWISRIKAHPLSIVTIEGLERRVFEAYEAGMRVCNAYDFEDLLLLTYRLLSEHPKLADFYRRLYRFVCIDEAQDMNEAQYAVIAALCGDSYKNVMMVGDPKQSIYGFNTSSPEYMERFRVEFGANVIELTENFRSSRAVVRIARALDQRYMVDAQLPIEGEVKLLVGAGEEDEARKICDELQQLFAHGHRDIEGEVTPSRCGILGRTRFALLKVEAELRERGIPYYKRLSSNHENESLVVEDLMLAFRVTANPRDRLHLASLLSRWNVGHADSLHAAALAVPSKWRARSVAVLESVKALGSDSSRPNLMSSCDRIIAYADTLDEAERLAVYEDIAVLREEWDQFLRGDSAARSIGAFLTSRALGSTQNSSKDGIGLLTVHSAKGLEFDVVVIAGMAEGVFPDYRAVAPKDLSEEGRNAFVAVTRSRRVLILSYPTVREMPWGGTRVQRPSRFLSTAGLV